MPKDLTITLLQAAAPPPVGLVPEATRKEIISLSWTDPFHWLRLAWRDLAAHPGTSLFYGLPFWCMALVLHGLFHKEPEYVMTLVSGCLLAGPFVAMGLYDLSRRLEQGQETDFMASLTCWKHHLRSLGLLVGVLMVLELLWGRVSLVMLAMFFDTGLPTSAGLMEAVVNADNLDFVATYIAASGIFAMLVFTLSVVSIPMILDRDTDGITAAIVSAKVVSLNTGVMLLWGVLIVVMIVLSLLLPLAMGLTVVGPLLGYASWHAYRGSVRWL
jgi:uncharacterized membrane protein